MFSNVRRGFLLVEAAAALMIIGVVAVAALGLGAAQTRAARRLPERVTAEALAQDRLAAMRLLTAAQLRRLPDSIASGRFGAPFATYRWTATAGASDLEEDLYDVRIEIRWSDGLFVLTSRQCVLPERSSP